MFCPTVNFAAWNLRSGVKKWEEAAGKETGNLKDCDR